MLHSKAAQMILVRWRRNFERIKFPKEKSTKVKRALAQLQPKKMSVFFMSGDQFLYRLGSVSIANVWTLFYHFVTFTPSLCYKIYWMNSKIKGTRRVVWRMLSIGFLLVLLLLLFHLFHVSLSEPLKLNILWNNLKASSGVKQNA